MDLRKELRSFKSKFKDKTNRVLGSSSNSPSTSSLSDNKAASSVASPDPGQPATAPSSMAPSSQLTVLPSGEPPAPDSSWSSVKVFLEILDAQAAMFGPLKAVIEDLLQFICVNEDAMTARRDYESLKFHLEGLFSDLCSLFSGNIPPTMTISMRNLCISIENELNRISTKGDRSACRRYLESEKDLEDILDCYRRIGLHLDRLKLNVDIDTWKIVDGIAAEARLKSLNPSTSAFYNSTEAATVHRRECTPKTREQVLTDLSHWRHDPQQSNMYWMNGMAGTGKTTITNSLCAILDQSHELGASFFCTRQLPECRNVKLILPTIAYQLARFSYPFRCALFRVLEDDPDIHNRALPKQFEDMIVGPLKEVAGTLPANLVIAIDALDECDDSNGVGLLLELFAQRTPNLPLKLFVSSRPEPQIRRKLGDIESQLILHELEESIVTEDIATYLRAELATMSLSDSQVAALVERTGVLFIYAATVVRYISAKNFTLNPQRRLATVLGASGLASSHQHKEIDVLYSAVLDAAFNDPDLEPSDKDIMKLVLDTVVCAMEPLTVDALTRLLQLDDANLVHSALQPLWSVLHVSGAKNLVTTLHASFPDYMLDANRSGGHQCKADSHHAQLAMLCFTRIKDNQCQFNICELESSYIADDLVPDIEARVEQKIPLDLAYACRYWASHLKLGVPLADNITHLEDFLTFRLLLWLEVMNLKKQIGAAGSLLDKAKRWSAKMDSPKNLSELLHDAWRFTTTFATNTVSRSTPHIYISMLPSWPSSRPLAELYAARCQNLIRLEGSGLPRRQLASMSMFSVGIHVNKYAYSPDGTRIATGTFGRTISLWDARTGQMVLGPLMRHEHTVTSITFSPDSKRIASGSEDHTILVWDVQSGNVLLGPLKGHTGVVNCVAFSPDGSRIASGSDDQTIYMWDTRDGQVLLSPLQGHTGTIASLTFSPDGTRIASSSYDRTIRMWDVRSGNGLLSPIQAHVNIVYAIDFSPDGMFIASASGDNTICIWDAQTGKIVSEPFKGHTSPVISVAFSPDGTRIASGSWDQTVRVWDVRAGKTTLGPLEGHSGRVELVAFSPDGSQLISGASDNAVFMWDTQSEQVAMEPLEGHSELIASVAFSPDGKLIASGSYDHKIYLWDAQSGELALGPLEEHTYWVHSVTFSPDGMYLASGAYDCTVRMWDVQTGRTVVGPLQGHDGWVQSVAFSPDGKLIVSGSSDNKICLWDTRTGKLAREAIEGHSKPVNAVAFSPSGRYVASGSTDCSASMWDAQTGQRVLGPLEGYDDWVSSIAFSPDGTRIITGSYDMSVLVWDIETGKISLGPLEGHTGWIHSISVSPDGKYIASSSGDKTIRMWDARSGDLVLRLGGHTNSVESVCFSSDGVFLASGGADHTIRVWKVRGDPQAVEAPVDVGQLMSGPSSSSPMIPPVHHAWLLDEHGWVMNEHGHLLFWVMPDLRGCLLMPHNTVVISKHGSISINLGDAKIGRSWTECFISVHV